MPIRLRKLIGAVVLIALVVCWSLLAMAVAQFPVIKANKLVEWLYLRGRRARLGAAGDAADPLDVAARCAAGEQLGRVFINLDCSAIGR